MVYKFYYITRLIKLGILLIYYILKLDYRPVAVPATTVVGIISPV
jgi:hypothetical protein